MAAVVASAPCAWLSPMLQHLTYFGSHYTAPLVIFRLVSDNTIDRRLVWRNCSVVKFAPDFEKVDKIFSFFFFVQWRNFIVCTFCLWASLLKWRFFAWKMSLVCSAAGRKPSSEVDKADVKAAGILLSVQWSENVARTSIWPICIFTPYCLALPRSDKPQHLAHPPHNPQWHLSQSRHL